MLHFTVAFLIKEQTDAEDVEQVESQFGLLSGTKHSIGTCSFTFKTPLLFYIFYYH